MPNIFSRFFFIALISMGMAVATQSLTEQEKIDQLLLRIEKSSGVFIRNGKEHSAKDASEHLRSKLNRAQKMFWFMGPKKDVSALEFIEKIASESSNSGKPYQIKFGPDQLRPTKDWLGEQLKEIENRTGE
jgi:hypothetical protein